MMRRNACAAAILGVALVLAGCTSTSGAAAGSSGATSREPVAASPSSGAPPSSSAPGSGKVPGSSGPPGSGTTIAAPPTGAAPSTGSLDPATTAWFTAFCGGLTPILAREKDLRSQEAALAKTDYAGQQRLLVDFLSSVGMQTTDIATGLRALPPPAFKSGSEFATKVVASFAHVGPLLSAGGKKLAAVDPSAGPSALSGATPDLTTQLAAIAAPITTVGGLDIPDSTKGALLALPACAKLQTTITG
jgi:hypothetical protein